MLTTLHHESRFSFIAHMKINRLAFSQSRPEMSPAQCETDVQANKLNLLVLYHALLEAESLHPASEAVVEPWRGGVSWTATECTRSPHPLSAPLFEMALSLPRCAIFLTSIIGCTFPLL